MNYCTECGKKIDQKNKFCTSCGAEIKKTIKKVEEKKEVKEFNVNNIILYVGVSLVLLATFIFAICTWENMSGLFKISFLTFEALLFFIISFTFAKINNNGLSKAFYMLAVLMIPVILYTIPVYSLLGNYLSYSGAGIFVYLAISNFICAGIYLLSYFLLNTKAYAYISYIFIYGFFIDLFLSFEKSISFLLIGSLVFILIVIIINFINNKDNFFRKSITMFTSILFSVFSVFMVFAIAVEFRHSYITSFGSINLYLVLISLLFLVNTFVFMYQNRKSFYTYFSPFVMVPAMLSIIGSMVENEQIFMCIFSVVVLALYGAYLLFKSKYLKITFKVIAYVSLYITLLAVIIASTLANDYFLTLTIVSVVVLGFNVINRFTENFKWMSDILIPLTGAFIIVGIINFFAQIPAIFVMLMISSVYLILYMIFKVINKRITMIYYVYAFASLILSMLMCTYSTDGIYILFLNVLLLILFVFVSFLEKSSLINIFTFIVLAGSLLKIQLLLDIDIKILFACISLIAISVGIILKSSKKILSKFYLYFGEILSLIISLTISSYTSYIVMALIGVLFVVNFISICLYNNAKALRIIAEVVGLLLIFEIVNGLIDVTLFSSIITLFVYMVVLVIFGLTCKEKGWIIIILSTACLIPYYDLVSVYSFGILNQLVILPLIVYLFVLAFYFKMKYDTRMHTIIWPLIFLSMIAINTSTLGIIVSIALALIYVFIGIIKKYGYMVTFGLIYMFVVLVFELFRMFNNLALIIAVLVAGLALIIYVVINEIYKSKKNK